MGRGGDSAKAPVGAERFFGNARRMVVGGGDALSRQQAEEMMLEALERTSTLQLIRMEAISSLLPDVPGTCSYIPGVQARVAEGSTATLEYQGFVVYHMAAKALKPDDILVLYIVELDADASMTVSVIDSESSYSPQSATANQKRGWTTDLRVLCKQMNRCVSQLLQHDLRKCHFRDPRSGRTRITPQLIYDQLGRFGIAEEPDPYRPHTGVIEARSYL